MRIERFAVRDFRKLTDGAEIDGLDPGLTVIVGDNEEGKSTLLKALQAVFFDRHGLTGNSIEHILPFGTAGLRPTVEVDFELDGTRYRLKKAFARKPGASLNSSGERWQGDAAEEQLRRLLGFSQPGRGAAKAEHRGLAGLLWVEQGRAFEPLDMNTDSQAALREAIEGEVGQVLGGERGRRLLAAVTQRAGKYFTRTGRERDALKVPRQRVEALEMECARQEAELNSYDEKVDRLAELQKRLARHDRDDSLAKAAAEEEEAERAVRRLEATEGKVEMARAQMERAEAEDTAAQAEKARRTRLVADAAAAEEALQKAQAALDTLEPERTSAERALAAADQRFHAANRDRDTADAAWQTARRMREGAETAAELQALEGKLEEAETLAQELERDKQVLAANPANEDTVAELRTLSADRARRQAALDAAAAVLRFDPEAGMAVSAGGEPIEPNQPVRITEPQTFRLQGFGTVEVTPGSGDIVRRRDELAELESDLNGTLQRLDLKNLAAAETALRERQALAERIMGMCGRLTGIAPEGVDELRTAVHRKRSALAKLAQNAEIADVDAARSAERKAESARNEAAAAAEDALRGREEARARYDRIEKQHIEASAERTQKADRLAGLAAELKQARSAASDDALKAHTTETGQALADCRKAHDAAQAERDSLDPERVRMEAQRARAAHARLRNDIEEGRQKARDLAIELRTLGQNGLAEALESTQGGLEMARAERDRIEADAKAWQLLLDTLRAAEQTAKEMFLGPVRDRLHPYLRMVFPQSELRLTEEGLEIDGIVRSGVAEPFASLSIGAREQVAVLARLALADLLREKGRPAALILDDPLVNTDDERFRRMTLALRKAADRLQIVVLTCHEARYEALGAKTIRLAECRGRG